MVTNNMRPIHPGEILAEEYLRPLDMTAHSLASALHITPTRVNEIVRGERGITPDTALRLARFFDTTPEYWLNLQSAYDLRNTCQMVGAKVSEQIVPYSALKSRNETD